MKLEQIPSIGLVLVGLYVAAYQLERYIDYVGSNPSHRLGFLAEFILLVTLLFSAALIWIGIRTARRNQPSISISVFIGVFALWLSFEIELHATTSSTELNYSIVLAFILGSVILSYLATKNFLFGESRLVRRS